MSRHQKHKNVFTSKQSPKNEIKYLKVVYDFYTYLELFKGQLFFKVFKKYFKIVLLI